MGPLTSFDYDLWISPQSRSEAFSVLNAEGEGRADVLRDEREGFFLRIASIADLIRLMELRGRPRPKDLEDIEYLKKLRRERRR